MKTKNIFKLIGVLSCIGLISTLIVATIDEAVPPSVIFIGSLAIVPSIYVAVTLLIEIKESKEESKEHESMERNQYGLPRIQSTYKAKR
jgi:hypothetical protein